jgi:putative chitinase
MQFKQGQIAKILGCSAATEAKYFDAINAACAQYQINTKLRLAAFIAQVGHESGRLSAVSENLNYSAAGLQGTWPNRFDATLAAQCARNPQKIANVVYANRMGNGSADSGDGWNYRGRGLIQCTGKSNYSALSQSCGTDCVSNPDAVAQPQLAAMSAGWFWNSKGLNAYADRSDMVSITKRINGGLNGQDDRMALYKIALVVLSDQEPTDDAVKKVEPTPDTTAPVSEQKTPAAQNSSIVEPRGVSGNAAKYPWNFVTESRSGHYSEVDDTPGAERLNMTHRTGSYWEINPLGTFTHKSVMDSYKITKNDSYDYVGGNYTQQVSGQAYRQSSGDMIFKTGGNFFVTAGKVQMNTGMLAVSGEINSPSVNASMFGGMSGGFSYGDMLSRESLVAYDLRDGGAPMLGGALGFTSGSNTDPTAAGSADSQLTNNLSKKSPSGRNWVTNGVPANAGTPTPGNDSTTGGLNNLSGGASAAGTTTSATVSGDGTSSGFSSSDPDIPPEAGKGFRVSDLAAVGIGALGVAAAVSSLIKTNDPDPAVANAMATAVGNINSQTYAASNQTPVFLKHVTFDKPVLLSQSVPGSEPDPTLYQNNLHIIVDPVSGVGQLHISDGTSWAQVNDPSSSRAYTDSQVAQVTIDYNNAILASASSLNDAVAAAVLTEANNRGAAVTAEATARQAADSSLSDLITTLTASTNTNAAAIQTEVQARTDAITAEANARTTLAAQVSSNASAITTEATTRANADSANASAIQTVTSRITNGNASTFAPYQTWSFYAVTGGWTAVHATFAISGGYGLLTSTATDPNLVSPTLSINGALYNKVRARVKRTAGSGWDGSLFYSTSGHGYTGSYYTNVSPDPGFADWYIVEWDMANLTAGGSDWLSSTITSIRIDLGGNASSNDAFQVDWISIGSRSVGIDGGSFATVQTQASTSATDVNNIKAQWAIKTNVNGYVSGIALVNDLINGNPTSSFAVQANVFKLVSPDGSKIATPFTVDSNGNAYFSGTGTFGGTVTGNVTGTVSGNVTGTVSGTLSGPSGSIGLLRNAASGQRTEIDQNGMRVYDSNGTLRVRLGVW